MKPSVLITSALLGLALGTAFAQEPHGHATHSHAHDVRAVLPLTAGERAMILEEMRMFLAGVQQITGALGRRDMGAAADAASALGQKMVHEVPPELRAKLPLEFRQLGFSVHRDFDQIALDAASVGEVGHSLEQLSATLQKCVACHATYQIGVPHSK